MHGLRALHQLHVLPELRLLPVHPLRALQQLLTLRRREELPRERVLRAVGELQHSAYLVLCKNLSNMRRGDWLPQVPVPMSMLKGP